MLYLNDDIDGFDLEQALPLLSAQRREQTLRFRYELGRKTCAMAYLLLCDALRREYAIDERPVFEYGEHGKPVLVGHPDIHFNFSHCHAAVACYVSDRPVGIDVESIRSYKESLARYTMSDAELQQIVRSQRPDVEFIRLWTMKEAVLKLSGMGIHDDLHSVLAGFDDRLTTVVNDTKGYVYTIATYS